MLAQRARLGSTGTTASSRGSEFLVSVLPVRSASKFGSRPSIASTHGSGTSASSDSDFPAHSALYRVLALALTLVYQLKIPLNARLRWEPQVPKMQRHSES